MSALRVTGLLVTWCALTLVPASAVAQLTVAPQKDLEFGTVEPSIGAIVAPTEANRRAAFRVQGDGSYIAQFVLPSVLTGPTGATFPLSFSPGDAMLQIGGTRITFDPHQPLPFTADPRQPRRFFLGGRAGPGPGVPVGTYTAVITLTIVQAGA
jgi:hypothetical protein